MKNKLSFKVNHNKVDIYYNDNLVDSVSANEFNNICSKIDAFKSNNPVLFNDESRPITIDDVNDERYGDNLSMGADFAKGLLGVNIRPLYFYKKGCTYLFYDFIYKYDEDLALNEREYGISDYDITTESVASIYLETHDSSAIKTGYITNAYLKGLINSELKEILKSLEGIKVTINSLEIDITEFWNDSVIVDYDTLLSDKI